jgi:predicted amidohydrolase
LGQLSSGLDKDQNLEIIAGMTAEAAEAGADLVLFPEYSMADFRPDDSVRQLAEPLDGPFVQRLSSLAATHGITVLAGMLESGPQSDSVFNTIVALDRSGSLIGAYRKIHLYDAFGFKESGWLAPGGGETLLFPLGDITFGVQTCYDLRFPELSRRLVDQGAECLLAPAAWVQGPLKESHWETLLRARAIENTVYVAAAGQTGPRYGANSMLIDPMGVAVSRAGEAPTVIVGDIRPERVDEVRRVNPTLANRRAELYHSWRGK